MITLQQSYHYHKVTVIEIDYTIDTFKAIR